MIASDPLRALPSASELHDLIRAALKEAHRVQLQTRGPSRELDEVIRKLDEAGMWYERALRLGTSPLASQVHGRIA